MNLKKYLIIFMKDVEYFRQLISHRFKFGEIREAVRSSEGRITKNEDNNKYLKN